MTFDTVHYSIAQYCNGDILEVAVLYHFFDIYQSIQPLLYLALYGWNPGKSLNYCAVYICMTMDV